MAKEMLDSARVAMYGSSPRLLNQTIYSFQWTSKTFAIADFAIVVFEVRVNTPRPSGSSRMRHGRPVILHLALGHKAVAFRYWGDLTVELISPTGTGATKPGGDVGTGQLTFALDTTPGANLENLILLDFSKPELGRVTGQDGVARDALVYGFPKRFELDYLQGDEVAGFEGTCALTSVANLLTQSGKPTTEGDVVRRAIDNQWAVTDPNLPSWQRGGSNANEQLQLLTSYGLRADLLASYTETGIANLVRSGRGVIVAVDAGVIWEATQYETGQVNHAVTLTGAVYAEGDGALLGFYVTDSGRAKVSDMTRFIPIDMFREAANAPGAYSLYTIEPVKLWDENIDGTGNDGGNQITGNRGDNVLAGMAGDDTLVGLKSRRWGDGGAWQMSANDARWEVAA